MNNTRNNPDAPLNIVSAKIRYYRNLNKWSYQKLSDKLMILGIDIHKQALYRIEKGQRTVVDYELCGFAKCFKITLDELLNEYMKEL